MDKATRERLKNRSVELKAEANQPAPLAVATVTVGPKPNLAKEKPKDKAPAKPKREQIHYTCGHKEPVDVLEQHPCPDRNLKRNAKRQERLTVADQGRLPGGSFFFMARYDDVGKQWMVELTVPGALVFKKTGTSLFKTMAELDAAYRKWAQAQIKEV